MNWARVSQKNTLKIHRVLASGAYEWCGQFEFNNVLIRSPKPPIVLVVWLGQLSDPHERSVQSKTITGDAQSPRIVREKRL